MTDKSAKSEEYRRLAAEASAMARASDLEHVREKHQTAALQWTALAVTEEGRRRPGAASVVPGASSQPREDRLCTA